MRNRGWKKFAATALAVAAAAAVAQAAGELRLQTSGATVRIQGTSTLHDWKVEGNRIGGFIEIAPEFLADPTLSSVTSLREGGRPPLVQVAIPVQELRSGDPRMDRILLQALKAGAHPEIRYELQRAVLAPGSAPASGPFLLDTRGKLTVAGVSRELVMQVTVTRAAGGEVTIEGRAPLKMTDFGIDPPRALLGTIRSGDAVAVSFLWRTRPDAAAAGH